MNRTQIKAILFIGLFLSFYSCKKCAECKCTWTYTSYELFNDGTKQGEHTTTGSAEIFEVCGSNDIKNTEKPSTNHSEYQASPTSKFINDGVKTCHCTTK